MTLRALSTLWMALARVTAAVGRLTVRELGRRGLVHTGWVDGRMKTAPARLDEEVPSSEWPECNAFTIGTAMGAKGGRIQA